MIFSKRKRGSGYYGHSRGIYGDNHSMDLLENLRALVLLAGCETTFLINFQISSAYKDTTSNGIIFL